MITIQKGGSYERPIVRWVEEVITPEQLNEDGSVKAPASITPAYIDRPTNEDGTAQTESISVGDNILLADGENNYLIPKKLCRAEVGDDCIVIYQGGNILNTYPYPVECNIKHSDLEDLVGKINALTT